MSSNRIYQHQSKVIFLIKIIDALIITFSLWIFIEYFYKGGFQDHVIIPVLISVVLFMYFADITRLYSSWRSASLKIELFRIFWSWLGAFVFVMIVTYFFKLLPGVRRIIILGWFTVPILLLFGFRMIFRSVLRELRKFGWNIRKVAIIGAGELGINIAHKITSSPWMGIKICGFFDDKKETGSTLPDLDGIEILGVPEKLIELSKDHNVDQIFIALPIKSVDRIKELITLFSNTTTSVYWIPDYFTFDILHSNWIDFDGIHAISIFESPFYGIDSWLKRLEDLILGVIIIAIILIPLVIISLLVKITSSGPVIFKQLRYGVDGQEIYIWKFRSMKFDKDSANKFAQAKKNDPRVTKLGAILRKTSLDELPQFFNVLQGRMSIVGPRPHPIALTEEHRTKVYGYMLRHKVKPGITGWAQVNGWRGETDTTKKMEKRIEHDIHYIKNWSLFFDLKIMLLTILVVFTRKNAY